MVYSRRVDFVEIVIHGPIPEDRDDIEVNPGAHRTAALSAIFDILERLAVGDAVRVRPGDGEFWIRQSNRDPEHIGWTLDDLRRNRIR